MPIITKLKIQRSKRRVNLYLDYKFAFALSLEKVAKLGLHKDQKLSSSEVEKLIFQNQFEKILYQTLNFLSFRPRSEKEVLDYLGKKLLSQNLGKKTKKKVLSELKKQRLIDDYQFSLWWVDQRLSFRPRGKKLLRLELYQKGVRRSIIDQVLTEVDEKEIKSSLHRLLDKKLRIYKNISKLELKRKIFSSLARRGFSFSLIKKAIDEKLEKG